jgi:hypothetical protein
LPHTERDIEIVDDEARDSDSDEASDNDDDEEDEDQTADKNYEDDFESVSETSDAKPEDEGSADTSAESSSKQITSSAAREHIFPILVKELVSASIMGSDKGNQLLRMFQSPTDGMGVVINAALDVYDVDQDMADLVDTLARCVA